ncbi:hypothetical protein FRB99_008771 [Tulasnella sp. 403]|nr:hypothetical protein FRB99_008771 [Tulasnella sp. 403]
MAKGLNASKEGRFFFFAPEEGEMTVNSNYRFDWNAAHFGHPNASRYYTSWEALNYFRVFCSNPNPKRMSPKGTPGADVSFRLHKEIKAKFISIIRNDYPDALIIGE